MKGLPHTSSGKHRWKCQWMKFKRERLRCYTELMTGKDRFLLVVEGIHGSSCGESDAMHNREK
jgi:hypothetical protein